MSKILVALCNLILLIIEDGGTLLTPQRDNGKGNLRERRSPDGRTLPTLTQQILGPRNE